MPGWSNGVPRLNDWSSHSKSSGPAHGMRRRSMAWRTWFPSGARAWRAGARGAAVMSTSTLLSQDDILERRYCMSVSNMNSHDCTADDEYAHMEGSTGPVPASGRRSPWQPEMRCRRNPACRIAMTLSGCTRRPPRPRWVTRDDTARRGRVAGGRAGLPGAGVVASPVQTLALRPVTSITAMTTSVGSQTPAAPRAEDGLPGPSPGVVPV